ncbi:hypothetical protein BC937DRAFT_94396 [Endogone sp. FLAS-F59071]|nr:hypothetical protein BC937DRAFT_94396 [Endogone sp. FLAS-F59071]|eukprot:RUS20780.1 hypothetical protein BC937DRAFT_94396 [Endogone sp. FLAS-F59071]
MLSTHHALSIPLVLTEILSNLPCQSHLLASCLVSRTFFSTAIIILWRRPRIYKPRFFESFTTTLQLSATSQTLRPYANYVHEFDIAHLLRQRRDNHAHLLPTCLSLLPNLSSLDLRDCAVLTDAVLAGLASSCPRLTRLWLKSNELLTQRGALSSLPTLYELMHLHAENSSWCTDTVVEHVLTGCTQLRELTIIACRRVTGASLRLIRRTRLRALSLQHVGEMTHEQIREMMSCRTLEDARLFIEGDWDLRALIEDPKDNTDEESDPARANHLATRSRLCKLSLNLSKDTTDETLFSVLSYLGSSNGGHLTDLSLVFFRPIALNGVALHCFGALRRLRLERWDDGPDGDFALAHVLAELGARNRGRVLRPAAARVNRRRRAGIRLWAHEGRARLPWTEGAGSESLRHISHLRHLTTLLCYDLGPLPEAILFLFPRWLPSLRDLIVKKPPQWDDRLGEWLNSGNAPPRQATMLSIGLEYQEWVRREEGEAGVEAVGEQSRSA